MRSIHSPSQHPGEAVRSRRTGFTLVELLVAISIIVLLIGIVSIAAFRTVDNARQLEVSAEIKSFESAIAQFKAKFGTEPPSSVELHEDASWHTDEIAVIRKIWPNFDFTATFDANGDGDSTDILELNGAQCLVFFLAGPLNTDGTPNGFSKNPEQPFLTTSTNTLKFYDFEANRLVDGGDGYPHYVDTISNPSQPFLYIHNDDFASPTDALDGLMTDVYKQNASTYWNSQSLQIISAGADGAFGVGGIYDPDNNEVVPNADRDNITNFHPGVLAP